MKPGSLDQISRRISAKRQLREDHQVRPAFLRAAGILHDTVDVAGKISNRGIDLREGDFHGWLLVYFMGVRRQQGGLCDW